MISRAFLFGHNPWPLSYKDFKCEWAINYITCFYCYNVCFTSDYQTFCSLFKTCHGCLNHDIVVGLCYDLVMRLSYYIHLGFGKKLSCDVGIEPGHVRMWVVYSTLRPGANIIKLRISVLRTFFPYFRQTENGSLGLCKIRYGNAEKNSKIQMK